MKKIQASLLTIPALLSLTGGANAVMVSWGTAQGITSNLDIQNPGSVHTALNLTNSNSGTINVDVGGTNVAFSNVQLLPDQSAASTFYAAGGVSADFESVLDSFNWNENNSSTIPFSGLTAGGSYLLQAFASDARGGSSSWDMEFDVGGTKANLYSRSHPQTAGPSGQGFINGIINLGVGETSFNLVTSGGPGSPVGLGVLNALVLSERVSPLPQCQPSPNRHRASLWQVFWPSVSWVEEDTNNPS